MTDFLSRLTTPPLTASWLSWWDSLPRGGYTPEAIERWLERARPLVEAARKGAPPPDEIAGLIGRVENRKRECDDTVGAIEVMDDLAEALRALAQENVEWKAAAYAKTMEKADLQERIRELEADQLKRIDRARQYMNRIGELEGWKDRCERAISDRDRARITHDIIAQERDAIRRKTIEECAALADDRAETWHNESRRMAARDLRDAIRALAHSESEGKEES